MKLSVKLFSVAVAFAVAMPLAHATPIAGSDSITLFGVSVAPPATSLAPITGIISITFTSAQTSSVGTGDLSGLASGVAVTGSTTLNPNANTPFTLVFGSYGTFVESTITVSTEGAIGTSSNVDLYLAGTFTPGPLLSSFTAGPASLNLSFTDSANTSYSGSGTIASPAVGIDMAPEPSSLVLLATGLIATAGNVVRRRRNA